MWDLFKAEFLRYRAWALAYAAFQLVVLGFMSRVVDMAQQPLIVYQVIGILYALTGLLLGLHEMGGYRRPNAWLNLLHRPLAHWRVAASLHGAGVALLAIAILLPLLLLALWQDTMTARVVDTRHVWLAVSALLVAVCGYLAGSYAMLANRRYSWCALVFLLLLLFGQATGGGAIAVQSIAIAFLSAMVMVAFKPDLSAAPRGTAATVVSAVPLQAAMWFVLVLAGFGVEFAWIAQGSHPNNMAVPPPDGEKAAEFSEGKDLLRRGLRDSRDAQAPLWREQARISEIFGTGPSIREPAMRGELTNRAPMEFDDGEHRVRWVFSHDRMRFEGYSLVDRRPAGTLGVDGDAPFRYPPRPADHDTLVSRDTVYQYDQDERRVLARVRAPAGETITGVDEIGDSLAVLTDRALAFYDLASFREGDGLLAPTQRMALPGRSGDLVRIDVMELLDGYLASFLFSYASHNARGALPYQDVLRVDEAGRTTRGAHRDLVTDYPAAWRYQNWYTSPLLYAATDAVVNAFSGDPPARDMATPPVPRSMWAVAGVLMLVSLLAAAWRTRQTALPLPGRIAWIAACTVFSLPALMALWVLYPKREVLDDVPLAHPATA